MNRLALSAATLAIAMVMGCSSPSDSQTDQSVDSTESPLTGTRCDADPDVNVECDGAGPKAYTLTSVDGSLLSGVNGFGQTIDASLTTSTKFRLVNLNRFIPGEPVFPLLQAYNAAVQSNSGDIINTVAAIYSTSGIHARISVKSGATSVFAFRPVP